MPSFSDNILNQPRPASIRDVKLPRDEYYSSPADWRNEVLYFLLPDRFSDGQEANFPPLDRSNIQAARPDGFRWDKWAQSGGERWQGGTIAGITSKLEYLAGLGVTTIWVGPVFKQRGHLNSYHGYAIQDFLEVDSRFGSRKDLVDLVDAAHKKGLRVILDIIFNHSGHNWDYADDVVDPPYKPFPGYYDKGRWIDSKGDRSDVITGADDGVWPKELQGDGNYTRAGKGGLSGEEIDDDHAEMKRTDFDGSFRDFNFDDGETLSDLARCYKYWIALTDCDGFRLDTLKHVSVASARNFCGSIKEFAAAIGKTNFFLVGEVGGPDVNAGKYLDILGLNLSATLDIGESRPALTAVAKGLAKPEDYFGIADTWDPVLGSHRNSGPRHVIILDDHDHVFGSKVRFSSGASIDHQVIAGVAIQLFTLGIPCIYFGTEQAFAGPEETERRHYLPDYGTNDKYLREIMFAAQHPRKDGLLGLPSAPDSLDTGLFAFGAFGTVGCHCFNEDFPVFRRLRHLIAIRKSYPFFRYGRQYLRDVSNYGAPFGPTAAGELIAWSRVLDEDEALCIVNGNGGAARGADVIVDAKLNCAAGSYFEVLGNTAQEAEGNGYSGSHPLGEKIPVQWRNGAAFVAIRNVAPSEVIILCNRPK